MPFRFLHRAEDSPAEKGKEVKTKDANWAKAGITEHTVSDNDHCKIYPATETETLPGKSA